jgi:hypothetical protein
VGQPARERANHGFTYSDPVDSLVAFLGPAQGRTVCGKECGVIELAMQRLGNVKRLILGSLIVTVMVFYFLYAVQQKGVWAGVFFVFVSFLALLYHLARSRNK